MLAFALLLTARPANGPVITDISPKQINVRIGYAPGIERSWAQVNLVTVNGKGFRKGDRISFGGLMKRTRFVSSHRLTARVPISDAMNAAHQSSGGPPVATDIPVTVSRGRHQSNAMLIHYGSAVYGG